MKTAEIFVTHEGTFHADEITSLILLEQFLNKKFKLIRTRNEKTLSKYKKMKEAFVVDVGMELNENFLNFDHHQDLSLPAACQLVWNFLKKELNLTGYAGIDSLIEEISNADTLKKMPPKNSIPEIVLKFNKFRNGFSQAYDFLYLTIKAIKTEDEEKMAAEKDIKNAKIHLDRIIELEKDIPWRHTINGEKNNKIDYLFMSKDNKYFLYCIPKKEDTFEPKSQKLKESDLIHFLHPNKTMAVFLSKKDLFSYINLYLS